MTGSSMRVRTLFITLMIALAATSVAAQGRGNAFGRGRAKPAQPPAGTSSSPSVGVETNSPESSAALRQFGAWLDDASVLAPGHGWVSVSVGHSRSLGARQFDIPVIEAGLALNRRAQFGGTIPYYRLDFTDGTGIGGFGDVYLNLKYALLHPKENQSRFGLAVAPLVEVLSAPDPATGKRWSWAVPVSAELRGPGYRVYGSAGYFARSVLFSSGAFEVPVTSRVIVTGALIQMRSLNESLEADALALAKSRLDVAGAAAYFLAPSVAVFGSVGRTISQAGALGTSLTLNGGVTITFAQPARP
jgi:hypothetical protein